MTTRSATPPDTASRVWTTLPGVPERSPRGGGEVVPVEEEPTTSCLGARVVAVGPPIGPRDRLSLKVHEIVLSKFVGAEGLEPPASAV